MNYSSKISLVVLIAMLLSLANPVSVFADEITPPINEETETSTVQDENTEVEPTPEITELPTIQDSSTSETVSLPEIETEYAVENLEQLPENTEIIVLDGNGNVEPLATEEAEEIILVGDPMWCPAGAAPIANTDGCTNSYSSLASLLFDLSSVNGNTGIGQNGTIWIEVSYNSAINDPGVSSFILDGNTLTTWADYALTLQGGWLGSSDPEYIFGSSNFSSPISIINWNNTVTLSHINVSGAKTTGITITNTGDINLDNVKANQNFDPVKLPASGIDGVYLDNCLSNGIDCSGSGDINITGWNEFSENLGYGLSIKTNGDVNAENIYAEDNWLDGIYINSTSNVNLTNINLKDNRYDGMFINTTGDVKIKDIYVERDNFIIEGKNIFMGGTNNLLQGPGGGLKFNAIGNINLENIFITKSYTGITIANANNVTLKNIVLTWNTVGVDIHHANNVTVICSEAFYNWHFGIIGDISGTLSLNGFKGIGNDFGWPVVFLHNGIIVTNESCNPTTDKPNDKSNYKDKVLTVRVVLIDNNQSVDFDCYQFSGTTLLLQNGSKVTFNCPITGSVSLSTLESENLPAELPEGMEYVSGLVATTSPDGSDLTLDGLVVVSFVIPEDIQGEDFAILYWDGTEWLDLDTATFEDGRKVFNGGYITEDGYFEALTNFSGNFVLVTK